VELEGVRGELDGARASLVAISVDTREQSAELANKLSLGFPLLADPDLKVANTYGVAMEGRDIAIPAVFVVRPDGVVTFRKVGESMTDRPSAKEVVAAARAAAR
jgi:peroxiredoxin